MSSTAGAMTGHVDSAGGKKDADALGDEERENSCEDDGDNFYAGEMSMMSSFSSRRCCSRVRAFFGFGRIGLLVAASSHSSI